MADIPSFKEGVPTYPPFKSTVEGDGVCLVEKDYAGLSARGRDGGRVVSYVPAIPTAAGEQNLLRTRHRGLGRALAMLFKYTSQ